MRASNKGGCYDYFLFPENGVSFNFKDILPRRELGPSIVKRVRASRRKLNWPAIDVVEAAVFLC